MENTKEGSKVWLMLCVVCTLTMLTFIVALSVGISEPVEHIHMDEKPDNGIINTRDKTVLGHPPSQHPKY